MASLSALTLVSVALVALAAPTRLISFAEAADMTHASGDDVVVAPPPGVIARQIAEIQQRLLGVMSVTEPADDAVDALAHALLTARGQKDSAAPMAALAMAVSRVLAKGALAEDDLERLAQDLYAASSTRALPDRDAGLLAIDVALLLQEAGAEISDVSHVLTALQRICPGAKMPATGIPARPAPARTLATLSRQ
jgi:hypothetical protein